MKSRVQKNQNLYENITANTDDRIESTGLSEYANRLNQIDNDQFERMNIMENETHAPIHARITEEESVESNIYDTFENEYLRDFLDEVKEYNVRKGYRSDNDTQTNILQSFNVPVNSLEETKKYTSSDDLHDDSYESIAELVRSIEDNHDIVDTVNEESYSVDAEDPYSIDNESDRHEASIDSLDDIEIPNLTDTDSYQILKDEGMNPEEIWKSNTGQQPLVSDVLPVKAVDTLESVIEKTVVSEVPVVETPPVREIKLEDSQPHGMSLEDTRTMQLMLDDHQKGIETISESMVRTNRVLNTVIMLVLLSLLVVIAVIVRFILV